MSVCTKCREDFTHISGPNICADCLGVSQVKYQNPTLNERETTHGDYAVTARIAQSLKAVLHSEVGFQALTDIEKESLELICTKMARAVSGRYNKDDYDDIAGYSNLVTENHD